LNTVIEPIRTGIVETIQDNIAFKSQLELLKAINKYESVELFEFSSFYNELKEAESGSGARMISVLQLSFSMIRGIITVSMSAYLFININWWIGLITVLSIIPTTYYGIWAARNRVNLFRSQSEPTRKLAYYKNLITSKDAAKEIKLFRLGKYIVSLYDKLFKSENQKTIKVRKKNSSIGILANLLSSAVIGFAVIYFVSGAIKNSVSVGDIILYIGIIPQLGIGLRNVINSYIYMADNNNYVDFFNKFISKSKNIIEPENSNFSLKFQTLSLQNVSFQYPNSEYYALKSINLNISAPGLIAIVGKNGAGKSTLAKILLRMYSPTFGEYYVDGMPVTEFNISDFRKKQSGVFQDFIQMSFSVSDNIWFGNIDKKKDYQKVKEVSEATGSIHDIIRLPDEFDTMLGKEFSNGQELSKGQWQKLIWARAIYSDAQFMVFDEPTSAIDPEAEGKLYDVISELAKTRLVFLISHRLSSVIGAKEILVLENGELLERGTHQDLIKGNSIYKDLFEKQASGYMK
jgi:ABC-type multidrug transport system fused ATPase/permease subunit